MLNQFLIKTLIFVLVAASIFQYKSMRLLCNDKYQEIVLGSEVYYSIKKSKKKYKARKVLLGDSVGKQLFDNKEDNDTINSLACNQAIAMAGQYILLENFLKAGNVIDTAYVFFVPFSFSNNLDQIFTYNYFVKQFYRDENMPMLTKTALEQIHKIPFYWISQFTSVLTNNWTPNYKPDEKEGYNFISPISSEYLHKMANLAKIHHFKLLLVSGPVSMKKKRDVEALDNSEISKNYLDKEFEGYFESIIYLDDTLFIDGTHLKEPEKFRDSFKNIVR